MADVSYLQDPLERSEICKSLPRERQEKIRRQGNYDHRRQSLGAGLLLQRVMMRYGISEDKLRVGPQGKPECEGLHFNLSHSGRLVACAVGDGPVGCDVEMIREAPKKVANRFFAEQERAYLQACATKKKYDEEFYRLWTMKESYVKFTGEGMHLPFNAFEILMDDRISVVRGGEVCDCHIKEYDMSGYAVSVCAKERDFADVIWEKLI